MTAIYKICLDEDPYHPCLLLNDTLSGIRKYIDTGDIFNPDPYPLFLRGGDAAWSIEKVGKFMDTILEAGQNRKAVWVTPQAFDYGDYGAINNRAPNFLELRNMQYQAIIAGAQGFTWFTWYAALPYPEISNSMEYLTREAMLLKNVILSPEKRTALETDQELVRATTYGNIDGQSYVFVVNNATKPVNINLKLPKDSPSIWYVIGENRAVKMVQGAIQDEFGKYDVHLYTTDAKLAESISVADTEKKIAAGIRALERLGNLAFRNKGVKIRYSSAKSTLNNSHIIDGCREDNGWIDKTYNEFPDWVVMEWNKPQTIARAEMFSDSVSRADLQMKQDGKWETVATFKRVSSSQMTATFSPVKTDAVRLLVRNSRNGVTSVSELEMYTK